MLHYSEFNGDSYIETTAAVFKRVDFGVVNEMLGKRKFSASCSSYQASCSESSSAIYGVQAELKQI